MSGGFSFGLPSSNTSGLNLGSASSGGNKSLTTNTSLTTGVTTGGLDLQSSGLAGGSTPATSTSGLGQPSGGLNLGLSTTSGLGLGLGSGTTTTNSQATTSSTTQPGTSSTTASSTSSQAITFKVLEDYINKWMADLDTQEKDFLNQATQLNALDKLMVENGDKIIDLSNEVTRLSNDQDQLEQELNFIYSQQNDLEKAIQKLEEGIEQMPLIIPKQQALSSYFQSQSGSDTSRIEMYKLLIEVDNQLKTTACDLRDIIKRLNDTNVNLNDPIVQISKILNSHMDSLNWIEENSVMLQGKVEKMIKVIDERYREPDSSTSRFLF